MSLAVARTVEVFVTSVAVESTLLLYLRAFFCLLVVLPVLVLLQLILGPDRYAANVPREPLLDTGRRVIATSLLLYRDAEYMLGTTLAERSPRGLGFGHVYVGR